MSKSVMIAAALLLTPAAALTACGTDEPDRAEPATSPETTTGVPAGTERLSTQLRTADGTPVANATLDFANGFATVTVETIEDGIVSPGFHGLHIHSVGECEANSVAPTGGEPGDFKSAGGHFQAPGHTGHPASGDLTSLHVRSNGAARLVTTTDMFTAEQLLADDGTALMIHQDADNFGHIPDRYTQPGGQPGPDQETLNTGDAGDRVACGVIGSESAETTTTTTTTTTPGTVTETEVVPAPPPATTVVPPPGTETETTTTGTTTPTTTSPTTAPESPPEQTTTPPPPGG